MSVVEAGSSQVRCGNIGEVHCTQYLSSYHYSFLPSSSPMPPVRRYSLSQMLTDHHVDWSSEPTPLWTSDSLQQNLPLNVEQVAYATQCVLRREGEPLMLVLQETWHERLERIRALANCIFESGITSSLYFARPSVCWALAAGKTSAIVLDSGHSHTTAAAVCDAYVLRRSIFTSPIGGANVTRHLANAVHLSYEGTLPSRGRDSQAPSALQSFAVSCALKELKECGTTVAFKAGTSKATNNMVHQQAAGGDAQRFVAPDGSELKFAEGYDAVRAREECFEVLFQSDSKNGILSGESVHLPSMMLKCRRSVDVDMQTPVVPQLLCGGNAQATNFASRMLSELRGLDASYFKIQSLPVVSRDKAWSGASLAAESSAFRSLWITKEEFQEEGDSVLQRKLCY